ncbi:flagellar hook-length control protein FliK [Pollutimonas sp. H1-120]|uniref:flagellar hook-length control protein FliK n=1 Tax=Pollutimonas sp. H1-120 TaxID=3148824 RepID=UPI003B51C5C8
MNTPTISAAPPVAPGNAGRTQNGGGSEPDSATPFSTILTRQRGAEPSRAEPSRAEPSRTEPSRAAPTAANGQDSAVEGKNPTDKKGHAADKNAKEGDEALALAQAAAEEGLTLPQIALTIAAEAAAVQQSSHTAKTQAVDAAGLRTPAMPEHPAANGGKAPLKPALAADLAASRVTANVSAVARNTSAAQQPVQDLTANPLVNAPSAGLPPAPIAPMPQATLLGANKAASLAGARQAVLTMQARAQASGDGQIKLVLPEVSAAMASAARHGASDTGMIAAGNTELAAAQIGSLAAGHSAGAASLPANGSALLANLGLQAAPPAIGAPLQSPQWASELGRQFVSITQGGHNMPHTAELRLDPPELGPLRITINISDNVAHAVFVSPHAGVRQAVENAMSQLQQSLAQAGISLGQTSVSDQNQPQQAFNESFGNSRREAADGGAVNAAGPDGGIAQSAARSRAPDALVDTFA